MSQKMPNNTQSTSYKTLLALAALGVVYGDIGTSPLYALKESFHPGHHMLVQPENILSILSLIFWSLMIVISLKYLIFILRADNKGEGGILALTSLISDQAQSKMGYLSRSKNVLILLGLFGTALLFGDGMITPAISILSAVEGLGLITPVFDPYIISITIAILVALFSIQKKGTGLVGRLFGPVTLVWFLVLTLLGITNIVQTPEVIKALNPYYIFLFFQNNAGHAFIVLGSVFLVVTGGEALYSDLGHFGKTPIRQAWFFVALPALVINYFGQGALLIRNPEAISNPFYLLAPSWALYPLVILAAIATTIASQALITGVFSITMQAVQNGYLPHLMISHTSEKEFGQIYVKNMNRLMMVGSGALVLAFRTSSNLASAYGLAVTGTMVITTILFYQVVREKWKWSLFSAASLCGFFLIIDLVFFGANLIKIIDGGWFPLLIGIAGFTLMTTWRTGRKLLYQYRIRKSIPLPQFLEKIKTERAVRVDGTAIYLSQSLTNAPYSMVHAYEHFKTVHQRLVFLSVVTEDIPCVEPDRRVRVNPLADGHYQIILTYGYIEQPDIPRDTKGIKLGDFDLDAANPSYVIGKESIFATDFPGMAIWREKMFSFVSRMEISPTDYFKLPKNRVIEIGVQIDI